MVNVFARDTKDRESALPRIGLLVIGAGAVSPLEAVTILRRQFDVVILTADGETDAPVLKALHRWAEVIEISPDAQFLPRDVRVDGLTTFSPAAIPLVGRLADAHALPALAEDGGRALTNKVAQRKALGSNVHHTQLNLDGTLDSVWSETQRAARTVGFPAVLKPAVGHSSRGVRPVSNEAELCLALCELNSLEQVSEEWLLESYLTGVARWPRAPYVSVESVVFNGRAHHVAVTRKLPLVPTFRELGQYLLPETTLSSADRAENSLVLDVTTDALARLGVQNAVTHTELMLTLEGPRVIEVNGRLGGLVRDLVIAGPGIDLAVCAASVALGLEPQTLHRRPTSQRELVFQYAPLAPRDPGVLIEVQGLSEVLALAGIDRYVPHLKPGDRVRGEDATVTLGVLTGRCAGEDELGCLLTELSRLSYVFASEPDGTPVCYDSTGRARGGPS